MKSWIRLISCLLLSTCIWLIHNLSKSYVGVVERHVIANSQITGRSAQSIDSPVISARCKGTGFRLILDRVAGAPVKVDFLPSDFVHTGGDVYYVPTKVLYSKSSDLFGDALNLEALISDGVSFRFAPESYKKVAVKLVKDIDYADQYMATSDISLNPDSILVYGEPSLLENVNAVYTKTLRFTGLSRNKSGSVKLEHQSALRYSESAVDYNIEVGRYVEVTKKFNIGVRNLPAGLHLSVMPYEVNVAFRCRFPGVSEILDNSEFYIDYNDFASSRSGMCLIKSSDVPVGVIECRMDPEVCSCFETSLE